MMLTKSFREVELGLYGRDLREQGHPCSNFLGLPLISVVPLTSSVVIKELRENRIWHRRLLRIADLKNRCDCRSELPLVHFESQGSRAELSPAQTALEYPDPRAR